MKRQIGWILYFVVVWYAPFSPTATEAAEEDPVKKLLKDVVNIENGKMTIREFGLLSFPWAPNEKIQVKGYSEAPDSGVISRDNFVGITSMVQTVVFFGIAMKAQATTGAGVDLHTLDDAFEFDELNEPIGKVDLEINLYMSKGGLQMEFVNTRENKTERNTMTWKELLE